MNACFLCRSGRIRKKERFENFDILKCLDCEIEFSNPMKAGPSDYYEAFTEYGEKWEFTKVPERLKERGIQGSLLDLGCGDGRFLEKISGSFTVTGLDFNPRAVEIARQSRGLQTVYNQSLEDFSAAYPEASFRVITAFHVLEHLENPVHFLRQIKTLLSGDGVLAVAVPNPKRWALGFGRENWDWPPHHLTRWTQKSLTLALEEAGFKVEEILEEPVTSFGQVKSGFEDIIWAKVLKNFSFGFASRLEKKEALPGAKALRKSARLFFVSVKTAMIRAAVFLSAIIFTPFLISLKKQGKTFLVLARK